MVKFTVTRPTYKNCHFLGVYRTEAGVLEDLYICSNALGTLIHRFSSNGPDYGSWDLAGIPGRTPSVYREILRRALEAGLLQEGS